MVTRHDAGVGTAEGAKQTLERLREYFATM